MQALKLIVAVSMSLRTRDPSLSVSDKLSRLLGLLSCAGRGGRRTECSLNSLTKRNYLFTEATAFCHFVFARLRPITPISEPRARPPTLKRAICGNPGLLVQHSAPMLVPAGSSLGSKRTGCATCGHRALHSYPCRPSADLPPLPFNPFQAGSERRVCLAEGGSGYPPCPSHTHLRLC